MALLSLTAGPLAGLASAHGGADVVKLTARESGCPDGRTYCFEVTTGDLSKVSGGDTLEITLANPESNSLDHNLHVAKLAQADVGGDTSSSAAYANTQNVAPGNTTELTVQVPAGADGIYLWCDVGVHEGQGMYREVTTGSQQTSDGGSDDGQKSSPGVGAAAGVVALAGLAVALRRR